MRFILAVLFILLFSVQCNSSKKKYTNIKLGDMDNEPSIMMNPNHLNSIVTATNKASIYATKDGGISWDEQKFPNQDLFSGDPCIVVDTQNVFYLFSIQEIPDPIKRVSAFVCYKSYDGGYTWKDSNIIAKNIPKFQDKEWAVVDRKTNAIYLTWTEFDVYESKEVNDSSRIYFSRSYDQGKTWSTPFRLSEFAGNCLDDDTTAQCAVPTVGPNSEIYVVWADQDGIKFDRSFDQGTTWLQHDQFVTKQYGGWNYNIAGIYRCNGAPVTDCDRSNSQFKGSIYINWSDQLNGEDDTDIWITISKDSGKTWTKRKRVNNDKPGKHQFNSWMTIDQANGNIYIVYYDRRNYNDEQTDVYLACSKNGGATFTNKRISEKSFDPDKAVFFGDYMNISAHDNIVRPIWTRSDGKKTSVWTAIIGTK